MFGSGKKKPPGKGTAHTLVSRLTEVVGDVHFNGELIVEGCIKGNVHADDDSAAVVRILENGVVEGEVRVPSVVVNGTVKGDVHSARHVELAAKAVIIGSVYYNLIEMVMGSQLNGSLVHVAVDKQGARLSSRGSDEEARLAEESSDESAEEAEARLVNYEPAP